MQSAFKSRVQNAINGYYKRQEPRECTSPKRKYSRPEKLTEAQVLSWAKQNSIHLHVVDSSMYDHRLKRIGQQKAGTGFSDLVGNSEHGLALYIELKAKDKRHTLSEPQRRFLERKIDQNCFAVVVDAAEKLDKWWRKFLDLGSPELRRQYLKDQIPQKRKNPSDETSLGFDQD